MKALLITLSVAGLLFLAGTLFWLSHHQKQAEFMLHHCMDGPHWKGRYKGDPATIKFANGQLITSYLKADGRTVSYSHSDKYECGRDGNIYFGCVNCFEYIVSGNKLIGVDVTKDSEFERISAL
ncbi:MAG: hypothetical protein V4498_05340 [candidate division FCPU426 bacterium]